MESTSGQEKTPIRGRTRASTRTRTKAIKDMDVRTQQEVEGIKQAQHTADPEISMKTDIPTISFHPKNRKQVKSESTTLLNYNEMDWISKKSEPVDLLKEYTGPEIYNAKGPTISKNFIPSKLPEAFASLPVFKAPPTGTDIEAFKRDMLRKFVGNNLPDEEFEHLELYCSTENIETDYDLKMPIRYIGNILESCDSKPSSAGMVMSEECDVEHLQTLNAHKIKKAEMKTKTVYYYNKLKYRGLVCLPYKDGPFDEDDPPQEPVVPGKDILFRVRVYRPFPYCTQRRVQSTRRRHPALEHDLVLLGRHLLTELRDRIACPNLHSLCVDMSEYPDQVPNSTSSKDLYPSGFLFINNVFYSDPRNGSFDLSAPIRKWAAARGLGDFPVRDMTNYRLEDLDIRLGYPEVYIHIGDCEHLLTFSDVRVATVNTPLDARVFPCRTLESQKQIFYCSTCADYAALWVVHGSDKVPFEPTFLCHDCLKLGLYIDGKKISDFKAYPICR